MIWEFSRLYACLQRVKINVLRGTTHQLYKNVALTYIKVTKKLNVTLNNLHSSEQSNFFKTFWMIGEASVAHLWHCGSDPTPDPDIFVRPSRWQRKIIFLLRFFIYYFWKLHLHNFKEKKVLKKSQNSTNQGFSYYFCSMREGSGAGSQRPKNTDPHPQHW